MKRILSVCALAALSAGLLALPAAAADFDATPHMVREATPGSALSGIYTSIAYGSRLLYTYDNPTLGAELWVSDGSRSGTHLVKDINAGSASSSPDDFTFFKGKVYFRATDAAHGDELWTTDGTAAGTKLYKDAVPGPNSSYAGQREVVAAGNYLYFLGYTSHPADGEQIWRTDGVAAHTSVLQVIKPTSGSSQLSDLTRWGNRLVFAARDDAGSEPWMTDGTTAVTMKDINAGSGSSNPSEFTAVGSDLFFDAQPTGSSGGTQIWHSDPPVNNLILPFPVVPPVTITDPENLTASGSTLFFTATSGTVDNELWKSDGTNPGTVLAKDINPSPGIGSSIAEMKTFKGALYFNAADSAGNDELWRADNSDVTKVAEISATGGSYPQFLTQVGSLLYFEAFSDTTGRELFVTDGTGAGTHLLKDLVPGTATSYAEPLAGIGNTLFFSAQTPGHSTELWAFTTTSSATTGYPKASYTKKAAAKKKISLTVKVHATGTTPIGKVYLKQGTKVVGVGVLRNGVAHVHITQKWLKGTHTVRAYYAGSVYARNSSSKLIKIKVK